MAKEKDNSKQFCFFFSIFFLWMDNPIKRSQMCTMCLLNLWFYPFNCVLDIFLKIIASNQSKYIHGTFVNLYVKNDNRFMKANRVIEIKCQMPKDGPEWKPIKWNGIVWSTWQQNQNCHCRYVENIKMELMAILSWSIIMNTRIHRQCLLNSILASIGHEGQILWHWNDDNR